VVVILGICGGQKLIPRFSNICCLRFNICLLLLSISDGGVCLMWNGLILLGRLLNRRFPLSVMLVIMVISVSSSVLLCAKISASIVMHDRFRFDLAVRTVRTVTAGCLIKMSLIL
jgi:hypothetical protein